MVEKRKSSVPPPHISNLSLIQCAEIEMEHGQIDIAPLQTPLKKSNKYLVGLAPFTPENIKLSSRSALTRDTSV